MRNSIFLTVVFIYFYFTPSKVTRGQKLLLANQKDVRLIFLNEPNRTKILASKLTQALACDYIFEDNLIFWIDSSDNKKGRIQYVNITDPYLEKHNSIVSGMDGPDGLACDWIGKKLYWTDAETNRIEVSELDGSFRRVLLWGKLDQPRAIALDPHNAYIYWTDWGEVPKIERAGMDGTRRQVLVKENIYWPNGITLDYDEEKVYWVEANFHFIHRMSTDGTQREEVLTQQSNRFPPLTIKQPVSFKTATTPSTNFPSYRGASNEGTRDKAELAPALQHPFAITLKSEWLYWTDWATDSIHAVLKNGSGQPKVIKKSGLSPMDLQVFDATRQQPGSTPCNINNGGCSHLCLLSPSPPFYRCVCPTGVKMLSDGRNCKDGPDSILLFARRSDIRYISLDTADHSDIVVPVKSAREAVAVDFDAVEKFVYWTDDNQKAVLRAHLNGSGSEFVVKNNVEQSDGIAIDWIARNLYWTDTTRNYISVSRLNGSSAKIIIETEIDEPRAIVLDPATGHLYWSDWGKHPKIERANLDGSDRIIFVDTNVAWPNGLALDLVNQTLFWADAQNDRIEMIFLNGTGRKVLLSGEIPHIFGLSYLDNYLYWTDWQRRRIESMRVGSRRSRRVIADQLSDIFGVKASRMSVRKGTNACALDNGGCSHLCLYTPKGPTCHCPSGLILSDSMRQCIVPDAFLLSSFTNSPGIRKLSLGNSRAQTWIPFKQRVVAGFIGFSIVDETIYWTDTEEMVIMRSNINGSRVERFVDGGITLLEGLAVDWLGRNVYWADGGNNRIEAAHMDRRVRKLVIGEGISNPRCLALDPENGFMYWSEWGSEPSIKRAHMDGSNVMKISEATSGRANSLTIDYKAQRLYWVDFDINMILSSDVDGKSVFDLVNGGATKAISSLTLYGDHIYWPDAKKRLILRSDKNTGRDTHVIESSMNDVDDLTIYHASRQVGVTSCSHDNGGCDYFCFSLSSSRHTCACPDHFSLNDDQKTCSPPKNFILISQTTFLSRIVYRAPGSNQTVLPGRVGFGSRPRKQLAEPLPDAVLGVSGIQDACAIDYDPIRDRIYWLDCKLSQIKSSRPNGSETRVLLRNNGNFRPFDLAIDPYTKLLFWTDLKTNSINALCFNGTMVGTVLSGKIKSPGYNRPVVISPRKIAIDAMKGRLYFSNTCADRNSCRVSIIQSALDGSECVVLFNKNLHNITALAVDSENDRLYWADKNRIEFSFTNGAERSALVDTDLKAVVGLTVFGQRLFWADSRGETGLIASVNKNGPSTRVLVQSRVKGLRDLSSVVTLDEDILHVHPCSIDNGDCSHICVTNDDGSTRCSCPTHLTLIAQSVCGQPSTCSAKEFTCRRKQQCIPITWLCDNNPECSDGSDEENCPPSSFRQCKPGRFSCGFVRFESSEKSTLLQDLMETRPQCIDQKLVCNGESDCINGQDESDCPSCKGGEKLCPSGVCVPASEKCSVCQESSCVPAPEPQDNTFIIVIGIIFGCAVLLGLILVARHCLTNHSNPYPSGVVMFAPNSDGRLNLNVEFQPHEGSSSSRRIVVEGRKNQSSLNFAIVPPPNNSSASNGTSRSDWTAYQDGRLVDRPSIPGASSLSSVKRRDQADRRHPPSEVCDGEFRYSTDSRSSRSTCYKCKNVHKHRRQCKASGPHNPPPPTPCTTDTCEDFEGCSYHRGHNVPPEPPPPYFRHHSCCHHCHHYHPTGSSSGSGSSRGNGEPPSYEPNRSSKRRHYHRRFVGVNSDSDPCPPPPTPRSQYMSEGCDTTEVEDAQDALEEEEEDSREVKDITKRIAKPRLKVDDDNDDSEEHDDETVILLDSASRRDSSPITERSYSTLLDNPPPSPVTDSS